ncbi:hypothetical protein SYK_06560 [Pseudodesulfovibrio nedwellii]|uniref:Bacteriocin n=1 Tax=Pseudodesulfovibrio nedwellii TaxID=2973072 RepID=A0ABN6RZB7_9BACT|nr:hypothetical protein [Pseudodesulfovibrio nedwellii]BDQ36296.1 hypothetical protein SYK_06560 [Pseudodesulfovibrio nedwellii]
MAGLGLYPIEDVSAKALQGMGQGASTLSKMGQEKTVTTTPPGKTAGGALMSGAGMGMAGFALGGPIGGGIGAGVGALGYLLS